MKIALAIVVFVLVGRAALAQAPDISNLPPHPRLWIGGVATAPGHIDPATLPARAKALPEQFALLDSASVISSRALSAVVSDDKSKMDKVILDLRTAGARRGGDLVELALAYDWSANSMTPDERKAIARHLGDLAESRLGEAEGRFNPWDNNPLRRDMGIGLVALAIAGDDPRAQELFAKAHSLFEEFTRITGDGTSLDDMYGRGAYGGGWPEGQDYDRHGARYAMIYFLGLRSATGVDVFSGSPFWKAKIPYQIYNVLPNGRNILPFQDHDNCFLHRFDRELMLVMAREFKDVHARWYLNRVNTERDRSSANYEFLYDEPEAPEHDYSDLPKAHYVPGTGLVYARSGWGPNDTYVAFCASDWYVYHQNNAQNVFAIYRNAPLAVKDGVYDGDVHEHYVNYSIRTISYNGTTVLDPSEYYGGPDGIPSAANDGGQMIQQWKGNPNSLAEWREQARRAGGPMRDIVDWKGFETNDTYTYCAAEAGRAYAPGKVPFFSRQLVFIYPNWVIVFDRVTAGEAAFKKEFHLHAPEELDLKGSQAVVTTRSTNHTTVPGRLFVTSLLPAKAKVERVEGFATYGGKSWVGREPYGDQILCPVHLDITAPEEKTSYFLTAMYACDANVEKAPEAKVVEETADKVIVSVEGKWKISFNKTGEVGWKMLE